MLRVLRGHLLDHYLVLHMEINPLCLRKQFCDVEFFCTFLDLLWTWSIFLKTYCLNLSLKFYTAWHDTLWVWICNAHSISDNFRCYRFTPGAIKVYKRSIVVLSHGTSFEVTTNSRKPVRINEKSLTNSNGFIKGDLLSLLEIFAAETVQACYIVRNWQNFNLMLCHQCQPMGIAQC